MLGTQSSLFESFWDDHPDVAEECGKVDADDGLFWIEWEDFCENYATVYVCKKNMGENRGKKIVEETKAQLEKEAEKDQDPSDDIQIDQRLMMSSRPSRGVKMNRRKNKGFGACFMC